MNENNFKKKFSLYQHARSTDMEDEKVMDRNATPRGPEDQCDVDGDKLMFGYKCKRCGTDTAIKGILELKPCRSCQAVPKVWLYKTAKMQYDKSNACKIGVPSIKRVKRELDRSANDTERYEHNVAELHSEHQRLQQQLIRVQQQKDMEKERVKKSRKQEEYWRTLFVQERQILNAAEKKIQSDTVRAIKDSQMVFFKKQRKYFSYFKVENNKAYSVGARM